LSDKVFEAAYEEWEKLDNQAWIEQHNYEKPTDFIQSIDFWCE
jgi:hypothetical protein